jgi:BtpA family
VRAAARRIGYVPVLANTGVQADRLAEILAVADGVIVGASLKVDGITWNPVDPGAGPLLHGEGARGPGLRDRLKRIPADDTDAVRAGYGRHRGRLRPYSCRTPANDQGGRPCH